MALAEPSSIEVYDSAAVRDSRLPYPRVGQGAFRKDAGALEFYYGALIGWRPPWNTAWGEQVRTECTTAPVGGFTSEAEILCLRSTLVAVTGRKYRITVGLTLSPSNSVGQDYTTLIIYNRHTPIDPAGWATTGDSFILDTGTNVEDHRTMTREITFVSAVGGTESHQIRVTLQSAHAGGVAVEAFALPTLTIDDVGPAANPTYPS